MTTEGWVATATDSAHEMRRCGSVLELAGGSPTAALHAVYSLLERLGWRFGLSFPLRPESPCWQALPTGTERIAPVVARRGIRQHLNFPIDLSAWPLAEARAYLRNLARLRFQPTVTVDADAPPPAALEGGQ
jgi:hypothetical protein